MNDVGLTRDGKRRSARSLKVEADFRERVAELGGVVLEDAWLGVKVKHRVRCVEGHECAPQPGNVLAGHHFCKLCSADRVSRTGAAEAAFRSRVLELGGTLLDDAWLGSNVPHRVRCAEGHECAPRPRSVSQGKGFCLLCTWATQDVVYVVSSPDTVKFGITSGDPKPRLETHRRDGFGTELRVWRGLPQGVAFQVEQATLSQLKAAGVKPVRGREYYPGAYAPLIVDTLAALLHPHM